jgi:hypothetical protein
MKLRTLVAIITVLLSTSLVARADTFELFNLNATLFNGGTLNGTVNLDLSPGNGVDSVAALTYTLSGVSSGISGAATSISPVGAYTLLEFSGTAGHLDLLFPTPTPGVLTGFNGGLCDLAFACGGSDSLLIPASQQSGIDIQSGTFAPAATPELPSFVLLGSGLLGLAGLGRRRFV